MNRTTLLLILGSCALLPATLTQAGGFTSGIAVGAGTIEAGTLYTTYMEPTELSESTEFVRFFGAYEFNRYFAVEASFVTFADIEARLSTSDSAPLYPGHYSNLFRVEAHALQLGLTASWPVTDRLRLRAGGGATLNTTSTELTGGRYGFADDTSRNVMGFEAHAEIEYSLTKRLVLGARATHRDFGTELATSDDATATTFELLIGFRL